MRSLATSTRCPAASVVIPVLEQRADWLVQCVGSALSQTAGCEVIVVVSPRSPPSVREAVEPLGRAHGRLSVIVQDRDGFAAALNTGIARSSAGRVGFLLSDDWLEPAAVDTCLQYEADIVSTGLRVWGADGATRFDSIERRPTQAQFESLPSLERQASYLEHFFLFDRKMLLRVGGVDENIGLTGADDYDLIWTLLEQGARVKVVPDQLYNYRDHFEQRLTLRDPELQARDLGRILDKHGVGGAERERILRTHSAWFGAPVHVAQRRLAAGQGAMSA